MLDARAGLAQEDQRTLVAAADAVSDFCANHKGVLEDHIGQHARDIVKESGTNLASIGPAILGMVLQPHVAHLWRLDDTAKLQGLLSMAALFNTAISVAVLALFAIAAEPLLAFVYGAAFAGKYCVVVADVG